MVAMVLSVVLSLIAVTQVHAQTTPAVDYTGQWPNTTAAEDRVASLPGLGVLPFELYSGYIVVNQVAGRALFYLFTPAITAPETAPLILWLNGGPGCSSLASGFAEELGPLYPNGTGPLRPNPNAWNKFASVIFLDSPAFTGFSYSLTEADSAVGDVRTTADVYQFLLEWFKRFPEFKTQQFYVMGESYAGRYVPQTAVNVMEGNALLPEAERINLYGVAIQNGVTDVYYDAIGLIDYLHSHAVISDETRTGLVSNCDLHSSSMAVSTGKSCPGGKNCCTYWYDKTGLNGDVPDARNNEMGILNPYQIYSDWPCPADLGAFQPPVNASSPERRELRQASVLALHRPLARLAQGLSASLGEKRRRSLLSQAGSAPYTYNNNFPVECLDPDMMAYYNRADVQLAIHANQTHKIPYKFVPCAHAADLTYSYGGPSMLPLYKRIISAGIKMLVYSGDVDSVVPVTGTRYGLASLKLPVLLPWAPWYSCTGNVGGRRVRYAGLDFFTVRNAGHETPWYQGERTSFLIKNYLGIANNCTVRCLTCTEPE